MTGTYIICKCMRKWCVWAPLNKWKQHVLHKVSTYFIDAFSSLFLFLLPSAVPIFLTCLSPTHKHTHTFYTSLLFSRLAPISLICSRNIIMFLPLINHGDREGPHYTWVLKLPTFFFLPHLFITPRLVCTLFSACLAPSGIDTWLLISTGERQQQPCPPGVFF